MGKVALIGLLVWFLWTSSQEEPAPEQSSGGPKSLADQVQDLTGVVDRGTADLRRLMTSAVALGDSVSRAGSVFSGGQRQGEQDPTRAQEPITGADVDSAVTDFDMVYSAEDPTSYQSSPQRMFS